MFRFQKKWGTLLQGRADSTPWSTNSTLFLIVFAPPTFEKFHWFSSSSMLLLHRHYVLCRKQNIVHDLSTTTIFGRGSSGFCAAWNFGAHFKKKYKSMNTKLRTNVNVYLKWRSQQIKNLKYLTHTTNITNPEKLHNILLINCLTHLCNTFSLLFFFWGCILFDRLFIWQRFLISFSVPRIKT